MEESIHELYAGYQRAVEFFNAQIERKYKSEDIRAIFRQKPVSESEFPDWWSKVSDDPELRCRWIERFEDPAGYFSRACRQISEELNRIPIPKTAA